MSDEQPIDPLGVMIAEIDQIIHRKFGPNRSDE